MTRRRAVILAFVLLAAVALVAASFLLPLRQYVADVLRWTRRLGFWAPVFVAAFYVVACVFLLPGSVITVGAGFLFGVIQGTVVVSVGSTLGAAAAFLVGRRVARGWVERKVAGRPRFAAIDRAVGRSGFKIVLLTRLSPIFPFNLQNYGYGLTKVPFWHYVLASWIGMLPGTVMYVYIGAAAESVAAVAAGRVEQTAAQPVFFWVGLAVTIFVVVMVTRIARRALKDAVDEVPSDE
jgi:uncharacterized membrane protein YdjX (TVP38/TMEM64 family)